MMTTKNLTQDEIRALIEKHNDILTPMAESEEKLINSSYCPTCKNTKLEKFLDKDMPFRSGHLLPYTLLKCPNCSTEFDPRNGIISKRDAKVWLGI